MDPKSTPSSAPGTRPATGAVGMHFQTAVHLHQQGQLASAQLAYQEVLQIQPNHAQALHLLGVLAFQTGNYSIAVSLIGRAIDVDSSQAAFHCNLGNALLKLGQFDIAIASYERALDIKPDFSDALGNRGVALAELRQFEAAIASYDSAIAANPNYPEAHNNRGAALFKLNRLDAAIASWDAALSLRPSYAEALCARGIALKEQGKTGEAITSFQKALAANPRLAEAHCNLAAVLMECGRLNDALAGYTTALRLAESTEARRGFVQCIRRASLAETDATVSALLRRAITEAWTRPAQLLVPAVHIARQDPTIQACMDKASSAWPTQLSQSELFESSVLATVAQNAMFRCILECIPIASVEMERFLTQTRRILLDIAANTPAHCDASEADDPVLSLLCAIAQQCYLNEFAFYASDEELTQITDLRNMFDARIIEQLPVSSHWLAAIAAYSSLETLQSAGRIPHLAWPASILAVIQRQILDPAAERAYRPLIPRITPIADNVSLLVREQYEESPYPRWIKTSSTIQMESVGEYLRQLFPNAPIERSSTDSTAEILIAGCGTGQQAIDTALLFPASKLLAIDLSLSSLCYAKRKTDELGLQNIDYAQADIMALGTLNKAFDIIESVGVLHHLADPLAGWRILLGLLKPGGFMRLGLYSELARKNIVAARDYIAQRGFESSPDGIRRCRQDLMSKETRPRFEKVLSFRDFFGTSECRDLIFHVQEHRFTLVQVKEALAELGLSLIGLNLEASTANRYHAHFPDDQALTNLDSWNEFEDQYPDTFAGMYQFWVQKDQ